jgi:hypothetical protein
MTPGRRRHRPGRELRSFRELRAEIRHLKGLVSALVDDLAEQDQASLAGDPRLGEAYTIWKQREGASDA